MTQPSTYRKKPVTVEAWYFSPNADDNDWLTELLDNDSMVDYDDDENQIEIYTLEGVMRADVGDYVIRGVKGELYPCKPDIFKLTYEKVND